MKYAAKWVMILRSPTEHENGDFRHTSMDFRHPGSQDASGDIRVSLDSSTPCWNDTIEEFTKTDNSTLEVILRSVFKKSLLFCLIATAAAAYFHPVLSSSLKIFLVNLKSKILSNDGCVLSPASFTYTSKLFRCKSSLSVPSLVMAAL